MVKTKEKEVLGRVKLENVRLSFADIFKARAMASKDGSDEENVARFHANFLIPKAGTPGENASSQRNMKLLKETSQKVKEAKWGKNIPKLKPNQVCVRDGDLEDWDGYDGHWYVSAGSETKPLVVDQGRQDIDPASGKIFAGCWVNAYIRIWAQQNKHGKRVNARLEAIQLVRKDEAFGAAPIDRDEAFDDISADMDPEELNLPDDDESPI